MYGGMVDRKIFSTLGLEERMHLFRKTAGISEEDVRGVQSVTEEREQLLKASSLIYRCAKEHGYEKSQALGHITGGTLAMLLGCTDDFSECERAIGQSIYENFASDKQDFESERAVELNAPEALRIIVFQQEEGRDLMLNAEVAGRVYGDAVKFSYNDLVRGIRVPSTIGIDEALYLGIIYAGSKIEHGSKKQERYSLRLYGSERDASLLGLVNSYFHPTLFNAHNPEPRADNTVLNSKAVYTWFEHCFGLSHSIDDRRLPDYDGSPFNGTVTKKEPDKSLKQAFLYGILARKARFRSLVRGSFFAEINLRNNVPFLGDLQRLSTELGYEPRLDEKQGRLTLHSADVEKLCHDDALQGKVPFDTYGAFFSPEHIRQLRE
jgi:hypothetical protein